MADSTADVSNPLPDSASTTSAELSVDVPDHDDAEKDDDAPEMGAPPVEPITPNTARRASLLKQKSSFVSPTGAHIDKPKLGRRLSFSDESGENLVETNFSDKLHYSTGHTNFQQQQPPQNYGGGGKQGCCTIS